MTEQMWVHLVEGRALCCPLHRAQEMLSKLLLNGDVGFSLFHGPWAAVPPMSCLAFELVTLLLDRPGEIKVWVLTSPCFSLSSRHSCTASGRTWRT